MLFRSRGGGAKKKYRIVDFKRNKDGIEAVYIDGDTTIRNLQNELRWNSMYFSK